MSSFAGKLVLITGASSGIGAATALAVVQAFVRSKGARAEERVFAHNARAAYRLPERG